MVYKSGQISLPFCQGSRVWQTDRQTDGRTEFSSLYRVCIICSAVKTKNLKKREKFFLKNLGFQALVRTEGDCLGEIVRWRNATAEFSRGMAAGNVQIPMQDYKSLHFSYDMCQSN